MKKHIILSVNDNPDYLFHVPLCVWAWRRLDWEPVLFFHGKKNRITELIQNTHDEVMNEGMTAEMRISLYNLKIEFVKDIPGYPSETITQVSRLYGACVVNGYLMTGDIDMIPLSDYWKPNLDKLTVWGRDLTDYHYPICYIGAPARVWSDVMNLTSHDYQMMITMDLQNTPQASSTDKIKRWVTDQDLITERINDSHYAPVRIDRGTDKRTGYPIGRVDRSAWSLDHKQFIDAHLFHGIQRDDDKLKKTLNLLHTVWPKEDWTWWLRYVKEFKKLCQRSQFAR